MEKWSCFCAELSKSACLSNTFFNLGTTGTIIIIHVHEHFNLDAILDMCTKGTLSQNFDICPSFYFMKCRKWIFKTMQKVSLFCHKIKTRTYISEL